jgi:glutathione S-transferase
MSTYTLYGRPGSGSVAVQIALEEVGAPYERIWVGQQEADIAAYRALNPTGRVPALGLPDGRVMFESAAILIHLSLAHPQAGIAPAAGTPAYAQFLQWLVFLSANVYDAALRTYYSDRYSTLGSAGAEAIRQRAAEDYLRDLALIASRLGPYVLGADHSLADGYLHMLAGWYPGGREELHRRVPALAVHAALVGARPAVAKTMADNAE